MLRGYTKYVNVIEKVDKYWYNGVEDEEGQKD